MEGNYLITTDAWFYAPDGLKYKAVWGNVEILEDSILGVKTNRNSSNWYAFVGSKENGMIVAGCQIHYAVKCKNKPNSEKVMDFTYGDGKSFEYERPSEIYIAQ